MPEGLEFHHKDSDFKRRKNHDLTTNSNLSPDEWESSSTTAPKLKRAKSQSDWRSGESEEVGDSDDLQLVGREIFDPTSIGLENGIMGQVELDGYNKEGVIEIRGTKPKRGYELSNDEEANKRVGGDKATEEVKDKMKTRQEPLTMNGTRICMQSVMMELKKAREEMLIWLRQEMQNIFYEGSRSGTRTSLGGQGGCEKEFQEQQASGHGIGGGADVAVLGNASDGMDFGAQASGSGGTEIFAGQNNGGGGIGYNGQNGGDSNYGTQNCTNGRENTRLGKLTEGSEGVVMRFGSQEGELLGSGFGVRGNNHGNGGMNFGGQTRAHGGADTSFHDGSVQIMGFERHGGEGDGIPGFRSQNELPEMTFGAPQQTASGAGGMNYASHTGRESGMVFGVQHVENLTNGVQNEGRGRGSARNRSPAGMGRSNTPPSLAGNHKGNSTHLSDEERTPDLIGIQNQSLQNAVSLSMMWNNAVQNPGGLNQNISDSGVHGYNYDTHAKLGDGAIDTYRGLVHSSIAYENSVGMMNSPVLRSANSTIDMQPPMGIRNATTNTFNASGLSSLMDMQNQVAMQNFSGMQNFLGLSMNGNRGVLPMGEGISRQVCPGLYLNERPQPAMNAKSNPSSAAASVRPRSHKRGGTFLGIDMLELNS